MNNLFDKCRFSLHYILRTKQIFWIIHYSDLTNFIIKKKIVIDNFPGSIDSDKFETQV